MPREIKYGLVIDVEATCWKNKPPTGQKSEIIEIGICVVDFSNRTKLTNDRIIVKPEYSKVSDFCTKLTSLTQEYVEEHGIPFSQAVEELRLHYHSREHIWISWGDYDRFQFERDCKAKGVPYPFSRTHLNLKTIFTIKNRLPQEVSVEQACKLIGYHFQGRPHCGEDDAYNIASLLFNTI